MYNAFAMLLNMSLTAGILAVAIIVFRFCFQKVPKKYICILWALVGLRLLCPISLPSSLSVFNLMNTGTNSLGHVEYFRYSGTSEKPELLFDLPGVIFNDMSPGSVNNGPHTSDLYLPVVMEIWLFGVIVMLAYALFSYIELKKETSASIPCQDHTYACDEIKSPFILGFIQPSIYLPSGMDECTRKYVIAHERAHIKRKDHWWKPLGYVLLSLHWFNPMLWGAYIFLCRDIETACDEKVISAMDKAGIAAYSEALLACAAQRRMITACPVAFGETDVKNRIKNVINYKKPAFWVISLAVIGCVAVGVFFMTNPLFKPYSFVMDGEVFSAEVINGEEMKLIFLPMDESSTWQVTGNPNIFVNDDSSTYLEADKKYTELHFTALGSGNGYTTIQHIAADGSNDFNYELKMVIKRHGKHLQIEEVSVSPIPVELNVMTAVVNEIDNGVMLVTPLAGSPELQFADSFSVAIQHMAPSPEPQAGDTVQIVHNGEILETYPAQLGKVYNVGIVSRDPDADETEQSILSEDAQAKQVAKEFCLDNGYTEKKISIRDGGSEGYVLDIIADKHNETKQITLTVRKLENGSWEVVNHYVQSEESDANGTEQAAVKEDAVKEGKLKDYTENSDGTFEADGIVYKYKLGISGRMPNASKDSFFVYLSNLENITFEQAWKAAGLSSNSNDYFDVKDAVLVEWRTEY